jgi:hypothetical protein
VSPYSLLNFADFSEEHFGSSFMLTNEPLLTPSCAFSCRMKQETLGKLLPDYTASYSRR